MTAETKGSGPEAEGSGPGFYIDRVPGAEMSGSKQGSPQWMWTLVGPQGETLARSGRAYPTKEDAQVAVASVKIAAREHQVPTMNDSDQTGANE